MGNWFVYTIKSQKDGRIFVGMSSCVARRVKDHNSGRVFSTKGYRPWKLIYSELVGDRKSARIREKYLKNGAGKEFLKTFIPR